MKIPEQVPTTDGNLTEVSDTEVINPTSSISQPLFRSHSQSHYFKRQFSKSDLLSKITIKTLDGNIKHVEEKRVTTDSEGNLQLFVPSGQLTGSSENSEDNDIRCIPAYSSDEINLNKGACSNIKFTDIITKNMTDKDWKDLCQHEAKKGKISMIGGRQAGEKYVGGSRFHPRIVLISDGNLTPIIHLECIIGNTNLPDLNTPEKEEETLMIEKLDDICREFNKSKIQVVCIPVGTFDKVKLEFIAENTGGKIVEHRKAASLGNERLKMVYAKQIEEGKMSEHDLKSKLLSMRTITADDFDDIIDISKNPTKYGIINDDDDVSHDS